LDELFSDVESAENLLDGKGIAQELKVSLMEWMLGA
jgi:hypothetical protein